MAYGVIWVSYLATCLLIIATLAALGARSRHFKRARFWPLLAAVLLFLWNAGLTTLTYLFWYDSFEPTWLFPYSLALTGVLLIGILRLLVAGLKKEGQEIVARNWSPAVLLLSLGFCVAVFAGAFTAVNLDTRIHQAKNQARVAADIIQTWPSRVPADVNAAETYDRAAQAYLHESAYWRQTEKRRKPKSVPQWLFGSTEADFDPAAPEVARHLDENRETLELLRLAASQPGYYQGINTHYLFNSPSPKIHVILNLNRLLSLSAGRRAREGDLEGAFQDLAVMKKTAGDMYHTPTLINHIAGALITGYRAGRLEYILAHAAEPPKGLIPTPIPAAEPLTPYFLGSLRLERMASLQILSLFDQDPGSEKNLSDLGVSGDLGLMLWRVFLFPADIKSNNRAWSGVVEAAKKPYGPAVTRLNDLEDAFNNNPQGFFTKTYLWIGHGLYKFRSVRAEAGRALIRSALAATAYKLDHGRYPDALDQLVPDYLTDIPRDPFTGKPVRLKPVEGGWVLSCVGAGSELRRKEDRGPIQFYLGAEAYEKYRLQPARKARAEREKRKKKK